MNGILAGLRVVARAPDARRLALVRLATQFGDGMVQAALGGVVLFDPARAADPLTIAAGFAVLLLPYSLVGPVAGVALDRLDRRAVLIGAGLAKTALIVLATVLLLVDASTAAVLVTALVLVGISRFVLAGMSAALPRVVATDALVPTNSALVTLGAVTAATGAAVATTVLALAGPTGVPAAVATAVSALGAVVAALLARRFPAGRLGPAGDRTAERHESGGIVGVGRGVATGLRTVAATPTVRSALLGVGAHRIVFGIDTVVTILVLRDAATTERATVLPVGIAGFGLAVTATATGLFVAALTTPILRPRLGARRLTASALVLAAVVQGTLVITLEPDLLVVGAFVLGVAGQTVKLSADAALQTDVDDRRRGRVFALQDTVFNAAFVAAVAAVAVAFGPVSTASGIVELVAVGVGAAIYLVAAVIVASSPVTRPAPPNDESSTTPPILAPPRRGPADPDPDEVP
ncbi:MFS transporter [Rhodococcoides corynebacterioides]|uniref:MFS transporter n=1 Tax=Rhodococcoides corynebacterioides TaxID=53972 RepID=A0ABS7P7N4_9NOCA|nr:MFS transporter [Rhodococcus corynebacterioides]MBY6368393.1 MFS transporter [Rhodococcus corynebacterioides]MBY6407586.1 MFS transporter [Rhodococcus corynebacterioides]